MLADLDTIHARIAAIVARDKQGIVNTSLVQIPEITIKDWPTLRAALMRGDMRVSQMRISQVSFNVLAADVARAGITFLHFLTPTIVIAALILAALVSWWWLLLAFGAVTAHRTATSFYRTVIFQGVTASEQSFCFLFSLSAICLTQGDDVLYRRSA